MRVLGLDPGSRRTGWGVVERQARSLRCLAAGHVAPAARLSLAERLHAIVREVGEVMERWRPETLRTRCWPGLPIAPGSILRPISKPAA